METYELILTAIALSMDAFAVAICKGLATGKVKTSHMLLTGAWFGGFQGLMPLIGFLVGSLFASYITAFDHWIAFLLLGLIGANMIKEAFDKDDEETKQNDEGKNAFGFGIMLTMAVATSIDALAVGISYAMLPDVNIVVAVLSIAIITFVISAVGVKIGAVFGAKYKFAAELAGGIILILMGTKILIEHLFFGG